MIKTDPLARDCPQCGAAPGQQCRTVYGYSAVLSYFHAARKR